MNLRKLKRFTKLKILLKIPSHYMKLESGKKSNGLRDVIRRFL